MRIPATTQKLVVAVVYVAAMFMAILDTTIVNVALPTIGRAFHARSDDLDLVAIAYLISLTVFIPVSGWLGDRIGGRRALLGAVALFTVSSALCGISSDLTELVSFRVLQGIGGAIMTPVGLTMLFRVYPPAERVRIASVIAVVTALAPALGPVLGGIFTSDLSWRLVFFVNVPIGVAALVFGARRLDAHITDAIAPLDLAGLALSGIGLGAVMYGISEGPSQGWSAAGVLGPLGAGAAMLLALIAVELRSASPLVDLRLFGNRLFAAATSLYALASVAYLGALFLAALFLQDGLGLSALQSGLTVFPSALGVMAGSQLVTRALYWRIGPRRLIVTGLAGIAAAMVVLAQVGDGTNLWLVRLTMLALGAGVSLVFIPNQAMSMATIAAPDTGRASALFNAGKQLGGAVGVALLSTVVAATGPVTDRAGRSVANLSAYHDGFLAAAGVALLAITVALSVRDCDAAATMVRRGRKSQPRRPRLRERSADGEAT
jgi:EmrB/QacA subfamily drug resistance transporter